MQLIDFYRQHGRDYTERLLDLFFISKKRNDEEWLKLAKELQYVGRGTKYMRADMYTSHWGATEHNIRLINGNGQVKLTVRFSDEHLSDVRELMSDEA